MRISRIHELGVLFFLVTASGCIWGLDWGLVLTVWKTFNISYFFLLKRCMNAQFMCWNTFFRWSDEHSVPIFNTLQRSCSVLTSLWGFQLRLGLIFLSDDDMSQKWEQFVTSMFFFFFSLLVNHRVAMPSERALLHRLFLCPCTGEPLWFRVVLPVPVNGVPPEHLDRSASDLVQFDSLHWRMDWWSEAGSLRQSRTFENEILFWEGFFGF